MLEQQKAVTLEQQQQQQTQQHQQNPMQPPQPLPQQSAAQQPQQYVSTMEQCAVAQQQKQLEQQQAAMEQQQKQQCAVAQQQKQLEQQQMEQHQQIEQQQVLEQQQQQQQSWGDNGMQGVGYYGDGGDGSQSYPGGQVPTGQEGQFYTGEPSKDSTQQQQQQSLGVYTPDSSTNSVHSLHGYPENHEQMAVEGVSSEYNTVGVEGGEVAGVTHSSVMESPSSIGSVEQVQGYSTDQGGMVRP